MKISTKSNHLNIFCPYSPVAAEGGTSFESCRQAQAAKAYWAKRVVERADRERAESRASCDLGG